MNTVYSHITSGFQSILEPALECAHDHPYVTALVAIGACGLLYFCSNRPQLQAHQENLPAPEAVLNAAANGNTGSMQAVAQLGANQLASDVNTPLDEAVENCPPETVRDPQEQDPSPEEVLNAAAIGNTERIRALAQLGVNLSPRDGDGKTPMFLAAENGHLETVRALHELGADVNARDELGFTPLHNAAEEGHTETVRALHDLGADVNARDGFERTPIFDAAANGHPEIVIALHELGADVNARDMYKNTPMHAAAANGHPEIVRALHELGADLNACDLKNFSSLHTATYQGHTETVRALQELGANANTGVPLGVNRITPLHTAAERGYTEIVSVLAENGADVNGGGYRTPLHLAAEMGNTKVVRILAEKGADINPCYLFYERNITPLDEALAQNHTECAKLLISYGARSKNPDNQAKLEQLQKKYISELLGVSLNL